MTDTGPQIRSAEQRDTRDDRRVAGEVSGGAATVPPCCVRLQATQEQNGGWVTRDLMDAVADYLGLLPVQVYEVGTFYSMIELEPVGRNMVALCTNISCMLCGAESLVEHVEKKARHPAGRDYAGRAHHAEDGRGMPGGLFRWPDDDGERSLPRTADTGKGRCHPGRTGVAA